MRFIYNTQFVQFSHFFRVLLQPFKSGNLCHFVYRWGGNPKMRRFCMSATKLTNFLSCRQKTDSDTKRSARKAKKCRKKECSERNEKKQKEMLGRVDVLGFSRVCVCVV